MDAVWHYDSPLGPVTMAGEDDALIGLWFDGQKYETSVLADEYRESRLPVFTETERWLRQYFDGIEPDRFPRIKLRGSPFRQKVWEILRTIPYGQTMTYGSIARRIDAKMSAQAVGGAVGHNPISLIVPCHRVLGTNGSLTGYAGGLERKQALLQL